MVRRRRRALSLRHMPTTFVPLIITSPVVGTSRLPAIVSKVDLPEPLGPIIATRDPRSTARSMLLMASTSVAPSPYTFETFRSSSTLINVLQSFVEYAEVQQWRPSSIRWKRAAADHQRRQAIERRSPVETVRRLPLRRRPDRSELHLPSDASTAASTARDRKDADQE